MQKTNFMWIGTRQRLGNIDQMPIIVGEYRVHPVSYLRCLGFIIDSTLCFSPHVSKTPSSCFATLRQLHSIRRFITQSLAISLVTSLVFPKLDYCIAALSGLTELQYSRLQNIINASARFVRKLPLHAHISPTLHELHWSSIKTRIKTRSAIPVFKCLCSAALAYLTEMFLPVSHCQGRSRLRSAAGNSLVVRRTRLKATAKKMFEVSASRAWNKLPSAITNIESVKIFKTAANDSFFNTK